MNSLMKQETLPKHTHTHTHTSSRPIFSRVIKNVSKPSQHLSKSHFLIKTDQFHVSHDDVMADPCENYATHKNTCEREGKGKIE